MPNNQKQLVKPNNASQKTKRPPVVVIMGHIDHGKSTLLDYIRKSNIVAGEAGGITQHVGAYQVERENSEGVKNTITFLDTPGHEAFGGIRERGAKAADIAVLVVSAEDGVKPQTLDAYRVIKERSLPYIVAINKIDKPNADVNRTKQSLGENEIYVEGWGGDVPNVAISAVTGEGIPELLDLITLLAELNNIEYDPSLLATGLIIESELDAKRGIKATLLIKDGTLHVGDYVTAGSAYASVRFIENFKGEKIEVAGGSTPVQILFWNEVPAVGQYFETYRDRRSAEKKADENRLAIKAERQKHIHNVVPTKKLDKNAPAPVEEKIVYLPLIIKADVVGSLEGISHELKKIKHDKVQIKVVAEGIGDINENDVKLAITDPNIILLGFHSMPDKKAASLIERSPVTVKTFSIIYELAEYVREQFTSKIPKEYIEETTGTAKILATFSHEKDRQVIGGKVESGIIEGGNEVKIMRRNTEIGRGRIRELQSKKVRVSEVAEGHEFGVMVEAKIEIAVGDKIEAVRVVEK